MPAIKTIDMRLIDDLFGMGSGYVLDFSDKTFAAFFGRRSRSTSTSNGISADGTSKAKRLR